MLDGDLFGSCSGPTAPMVKTVPGLVYAADFLSGEEAKRIVASIDSSVWSEDLRRRVQHYGYKYDYKARSISESMRAAPLPPWAVSLGNRLVKRGLFEVVPDQVIVNEYLPGQGIAPHIDCVPCFGDTVASVSFLAPCVMVFSKVSGGEAVDIDLASGSVVLLSGECRYDWRHGIAARSQDRVAGAVRPRMRRLSATFRTVVLKQDRRPANRQVRNWPEASAAELGFRHSSAK